ncbi:TfoX/Sxy family protein [Variovorax sp. J22G73]|jgi:DNA transformation protein|uniref:TfoX/Sxy family protein n=1 Tax=unclassified Variovorax TaxID=663243 RepID=UPI000D5F5956|nr:MULTISPECIES: TfoX/Sxy family protein [unclassified Variovorax]MDM0003825.1 TfoX/Sxy family protein [Variovorax sp. J22R203]MDM0096509.1 TfoX/Sxy family protein [Variovorax sp. J22G73]
MSAFVDSLHEIFERFGRIAPRRMFGGHGIFHEGRMIAIVQGDTLYLKSDVESAPHFDRQNLPPFTYMRQGQETPLSYRQAPADLFEDREEAALWGRRAYEAALRSGQPPKPRKPSAARKSPAKKVPARKVPAKKAAARKAPVKTPAKKASVKNATKKAAKKTAKASAR